MSTHDICLNREKCQRNNQNTIYYLAEKKVFYLQLCLKMAVSNERWPEQPVYRNITG